MQTGMGMDYSALEGQVSDWAEAATHSPNPSSPPLRPESQEPSPDALAPDFLKRMWGPELSRIRTARGFLDLSVREVRGRPSAESPWDPELDAWCSLLVRAPLLAAWAACSGGAGEDDAACSCDMFRRRRGILDFWAASGRPPGCPTPLPSSEEGLLDAPLDDRAELALDGRSCDTGWDVVASPLLVLESCAALLCCMDAIFSTGTLGTRLGPSPAGFLEMEPDWEARGKPVPELALAALGSAPDERRCGVGPGADPRWVCAPEGAPSEPSLVLLRGGVMLAARLGGARPGLAAWPSIERGPGLAPARRGGLPGLEANEAAAAAAAAAYDVGLTLARKVLSRDPSGLGVSRCFLQGDCSWS